MPTQSEHNAIDTLGGLGHELREAKEKLSRKLSDFRKGRHGHSEVPSGQLSALANLAGLAKDIATVTINGNVIPKTDAPIDPEQRGDTCFPVPSTFLPTQTRENTETCQGSSMSPPSRQSSNARRREMHNESTSTSDKPSSVIALAWGAKATAEGALSHGATSTSHTNRNETSTVVQEVYPQTTPRPIPRSLQTERNDISSSADSSRAFDAGTSPISPSSAGSSHFSIDPFFSPIIPVLNIHQCEPVPDLTGRIKRTNQTAAFAGTMSTVFQAKLDDGRMVAVKGLRIGEHDSATILRRFTREAATWWCLKHKNILPLYGWVRAPEAGSFAGLVSPWCKYGTSAEYLQKHGSRLTIADRLRLFLGVADGIHFLHTFHPVVIHGDLKPANVLIDDEKVPRLCDFGLLRLLRGENEESTGVTTKSACTGTTRYLSYELVAEGAENVKISAASDVYALACVGMEFLYSTLPHSDIPSKGRADYRVTKAIDDKKPPAIRPPNAEGAIADLWTLFERAWSLEPSLRPSAGDVCQFLRQRSEDIAKEFPR